MPPGFTGKRCETNINECINNPCVNGECKDEVNGYKCQCNSGFFGQNCDISCPTENSNYRVVDNLCYYFNTTYKNYDTQKQFCKTLFSGNGRLFEPKDLATYNKLYQVAKDNFSREYWFFGIQDPYKNGTLEYASNNLPLPFTVPYGGIGYSEKCVLICPPGVWYRWCCTSCNQYAICENSS